MPNIDTGTIKATSYRLTTSGFFLHLLSYFIASLLCSKAFKQNSINFILIWGTAIFLYSVFLEVIQFFLPYRVFNVYDILANFIGIALGMIIFVIFTGFYRKIESIS